MGCLFSSSCWYSCACKRGLDVMLVIRTGGQDPGVFFNTRRCVYNGCYGCYSTHVSTELDTVCKNYYKGINNYWRSYKCCVYTHDKCPPKQFDVIMTAVDVIMTAVDVIMTAVDVIMTAVDVIMTAVDVIMTAVDVIMTAVDVINDSS
ncbi:hypothetical protein OS493_034805 [Desmophyllum pertusum]|uniref:Uncharacterized protein n=1 Tax=Desmophyllum pertusum TaxID=174260 RepID=A0A9W9YIT0_9CNID|nr:hypothetical protein OS493_034805 [Desmophyllum pertusum]